MRTLQLENSPCLPQLEKSPRRDKDLAQAKIIRNFFKRIYILCLDALDREMMVT